jgi:regulator of protease activity HflC (stomatin/prohibitin superfamily)
MAHAKCRPCGARVWHEGPAPDPVDDLCPGCGGPLEAVADLSELVGLRALRARPRQAGLPPDLSARISQQIRETIARNDAARRRSDGERA